MPDAIAAAGPKFTTAVSHCFTELQRTRGRRLVDDGRVAVFPPDKKGAVDGIVLGKRCHAVRLEPRDRGIAVWCTCAWVNFGTTCRHLWAVLLAAESAGQLARWNRRAPYIFPRATGCVLDLEVWMTLLPVESCGLFPPGTGRTLHNDAVRRPARGRRTNAPNRPATRGGQP